MQQHLLGKNLGAIVFPTDSQEKAIQLLQHLEFTEYEASCYVGLLRLDAATSKKLSEATDVPRTRVYDAIRVLEAQGLVEVHHSSPKQFRAVPIQEALDRIRNRYQSRFAELKEALNTIEPLESTDTSPTQRVWSVTGREAIESRAIQLAEEASTEVLVLLAEPSLLTESFAEALRAVGGTVEVVIFAPTEAMCEQIRELVPVATTVFSGLEQFHDPTTQPTLGRILAIDNSASLVSSIDPDTGEERAVFSQGPTTPLVSLIRQLRVDNGLFTAPEFEP